MEAIISRSFLSTVLLIGCISIPSIATPYAQAPEVKQHRSAEAGKSEDSVSEGLTGSDWNSIRQVYENNRHAAVAVDGGFRARNLGQQWLTRFDGRGFAVEPDGTGWRWGLELKSYGFPGHERTVNGQAKMTAQDDRVSYNWHDELQEWFVNDRAGLEHGFTLISRPPGAGDPHLGVSEWLELRLACPAAN